MRAMAYREYGEPNTLELTEMPAPKIAPGSVQIRVERAAVNPVDWKILSGGLDGMLDTVFPVIPGWDVSGVVEAVGPDVPEFSVGDRVASYARKDYVHGGTYAELVNVPAASVAHVPDNVDFDSAAGLPLAGLTALRSLETLQLNGEDTLLIHAASGGVGYIAAQLAVAQGATVIGTAGEENHQKLRELGVTPVVYGDGLPERVKEIAPDGVTTVADFVGGVLEQTLEVLAPQGRHVSIADDTVEQHGGQWVWVRPDGPRLETLLGRIDQDELAVDVDSIYPLEKAGEALERNQSGARGKIIIDVTA